jgi:hypothetical protein
MCRFIFFFLVAITLCLNQTSASDLGLTNNLGPQTSAVKLHVHEEKNISPFIGELALELFPILEKIHESNREECRLLIMGLGNKHKAVQIRLNQLAFNHLAHKAVMKGDHPTSQFFYFLSPPPTLLTIKADEHIFGTPDLSTFATDCVKGKILGQELNDFQLKHIIIQMLNAIFSNSIKLIKMEKALSLKWGPYDFPAAYLTGKSTVQLKKDADQAALDFILTCNRTYFAIEAKLLQSKHGEKYSSPIDTHMFAFNVLDFDLSTYLDNKHHVLREFLASQIAAHECIKRINLTYLLEDCREAYKVSKINMPIAPAMVVNDAHNLLELQIGELTQKLQTLQKQLTLEEREKKKLDKQVRTLNNLRDIELPAKESKIAALGELNKKIVASLQQHKEELNTKKQELVRLNKQLADKEEALVRAAKELTKTQKAKQKSTLALEKEKSSLAAMETKLKEMQAQLMLEQQRNVQLTSENTRLQQVATDTSQENAGLKKTNEQLGYDVIAKDASIHALQQACHLQAQSLNSVGQIIEDHRREAFVDGGAHAIVFIEQAYPRAQAEKQTATTVEQKEEAVTSSSTDDTPA